MPSKHRADQIDARLLVALSVSPRATTIALAERINLSPKTTALVMHELVVPDASAGREDRRVAR